MASVPRSHGLASKEAVGEEAVEPDRHAETDEDVHDGEDREVEAGDGSTPQQPQGRDESEEGQHNGHHSDLALKARCACRGHA